MSRILVEILKRVLKSGDITLQVHEMPSWKGAIARFLESAGSSGGSGKGKPPPGRYRLIPYFTQNHTACQEYFQELKQNKAAYDKITKRVDIFVPADPSFGAIDPVYEAIEESDPSERLSMTDLPFLRLMRGNDKQVIPLKRGASEFSKSEIETTFNYIMEGSRKGHSPKRIKADIMNATNPDKEPSAQFHTFTFLLCFMGLLCVLGIYLWAATSKDVSADTLPVIRYLLLVLTAGLGAVLVFGILRSKGLFSGSIGVVSMKFGGAAACLFGLVWIGNDVVFGRAPTFDMTVYLSDETSGATVAIPAKLQLRLSPRIEAETGNGVFDVRGIPSNQKGKSVGYSLELRDLKYERVPGPDQLMLEGGDQGTIIKVRVKPQPAS